jgi:hypothetical protein
VHCLTLQHLAADQKCLLHIADVPLLLLLLLLLQSCHMACDVVDEKGVYLTTGNPLPSDIESVMNWLLNEEFTTAFQSG